MVLEIQQEALAALMDGGHGAPFQILGAHQTDTGYVTIRNFRPTAKQVFVVNLDTDERTEMTRTTEEGLYEATIKGKWPGLNYRFEAVDFDGQRIEYADPYIYDEPLLTDLDLHLFGEGHHYRIFEKMGAHLREIDGVTGVNFAVWAPNAHAISVVGDFNRWDTRSHPMQRNRDGGVWELFIPGLGVGDKYKFHVRSQYMGYQIAKTDPYGFFSELRPNTASIVADLSTYTWNDDAWMQARKERDLLNQPMMTYEVHLGSWKRNAEGDFMTYRELADDLIPYVKEMGYTHLELLPVAEHPLDMSWGYQVVGYYAATSRFGTPQDFMYFVDQCHQNGIGVILDWVPAHFPKDGHGLSYFDGTHLYEHADSRKGEHPDWGTYIFNYGRNEVRNFLIANALFWLEYYHIDGLRVDAVSSMIYLSFGREEGQWIPNEFGGNENLEALSFMREANEVLHREYPGAMTLAEESTSWAMVSRPTYIGGLGFTFKWNMGWMHDTLYYMRREPIHRKYHHNNMTFSLMYAFSENFVLSLSHDEVVHGKGSLINKMSGDWWQKFANLRLLFGYQATHPGKKLTFMGQEFAQWREWSEARGLDWHLVENWETHQKMQAYVRDLNALYKREPALYEVDFEPEGFQWIEPNDWEQSVYSFIRYARNRDDFLVIIGNFTPVVRENYRIGVSVLGYYEEILNSDSEHYGGGNVGNGGGRYAEPMPWQGFQHSLSLTVPPLGILILKCSR